MSSAVKRIYILNQGRQPYLNFLRNLTPQVLLLSSALLLGRNFEARLDLANWGPTFAVIVLIAGFCLAAWINTVDFLNDAVKRFEKWKRRTGRLLTSRQMDQGPRRTAARAIAIFRKKKVEVVEVFMIVFFLQSAFAIVVANAIIAVIVKH